MSDAADNRRIVAYTSLSYPCPDCGFPLLGQPVEQWEEGVLVTRCPECGRAIGHPLGLLSRRELRQMVGLRGLGWWFGLVAVLLAPGAIFGAAASHLAWRLSEPFAAFIARTWYREGLVEFEASGQPGHYPRRLQTNQVDDDWLASQDLGALLNACGGWLSLDWGEVAAYLGWMLVVATAAAIGMALALPTLRTWRIVLVGMGSAGFVGVAIFYARHGTTTGRKYLLNADLAAYLTSGLPPAIVLILVTLAIYGLALFLARAAARRAVYTLTGDPPRYTLPELWTADGLDMPGPKTPPPEPSTPREVPDASE